MIQVFTPALMAALKGSIKIKLADDIENDIHFFFNEAGNSLSILMPQKQNHFPLIIFDNVFTFFHHGRL